MEKDRLVGEEEASEPRKRLAQLPCYYCGNVEDYHHEPEKRSSDSGAKLVREAPDSNLMESELLHLATDHPDVFEKNFTRHTHRDWNEKVVCSPLSAFVNLLYRRDKKCRKSGGV